MANEKEYIVTLKKGVNKQDFDAFMRSQYGNETVPERSVDVVNSRPASQRIVHYALNDEEAAHLKNNPSVIDVEIPVEQNPDIIIGHNASQTGTFTRGSPTANSVNWGLARSLVSTNIFTSYNNSPLTYTYPLDGTGVDVVIQDSGIDADHPEWQDSNGNSRLAQIDWYAESGLPGTQDANFYTDYDGHGTHCAGIACGKTYGWAKGAHLYAQKLAGLEGPADPNSGISMTDAFDVIRLWHLNKTNGRPTVVNMSWGFFSLAYGDPISGTYRGSPWTFSSQSQFALWQSYGIVSQFSDPEGGPPFRRFQSTVAYVNAEVEDMIDAGIHICIAAGNDYYKVDVPGGVDYNNSLDIYRASDNTNQATYNYHQGGSPYSARAFNVGNISTVTLNNLDIAAASSQRGPAVNIWAPGTQILSTSSRDRNVIKFPSVFDYPSDNTYKIMSISGTSMAAPQVAGFAACYLQMSPNATPEEVLNKVIDLSKPEMSNGSDTDYTDNSALLEGPNRVLITPFLAEPITTTGAFSIANAGYEFDTSADDPVPSPAPQGQTLTIGVTNVGSGSYSLSGDVTGSNATVNCNAGDTLIFNVNAPSHPFYIKTSATTGTGNQASGVTNNGSQSGQVSWTPTTPGTYFYICQFHSGMQGQIVVS